MSITPIPVRSSNNVNASADINTLDSNIDSLAAESGPGFRNYIIDPDFAYWSNGTSIGSTGYGPDVWAVDFQSATGTFSRQVHYDALVRSYFARFAISTATANTNFINKIDNVSTLANREVSVLMRLKSSTGVTTLQPQLLQVKGTGTPVSGGDILAIPSDDTWDWYRSDITVKALSGTYTAGNHISLRIINATAEAYTLDIDKVVMIEKPVNVADDVVPEFIKTDQIELTNMRNVRSYFQVLGSDLGLLIADGESTSANTGNFKINLADELIQLPTITESIASGLTYVDTTNGTSTASVAPSYSSIRVENGILYFTLTDTGKFAGGRAGLKLYVNANQTLTLDSRF
jgi:hypothetical protein